MRLYLFLEGRRLGEAMGRGDLRCHNGSLHPCGPTLPLKGRGIAYERRAPPSPFSPAGRRCRQADEGVPAKTTKIHEFKSITPSSDPSGHLLPKGRRSL